MKQIGSIYINGEYKILYDEKDKYTPYRIVSVWYNCGKHRKTVAKYSDLKSALYDLYASI